MTEKNYELLSKIIIVLAGIISTIAMAVAGWTVGQVIDAQSQLYEIRADVRAIQANRFTIQDGVLLKEAILNKIPPKWVEKKFEDYDEHIRVYHGKWKKEP